MPHACVFVPLRGNHSTKNFRVYLDSTVHDDLHLLLYDDHLQIRPLEDITFYSIWLTCGSLMRYPHMTRRDVDFIYVDFLNHRVLCEKNVS